MRTPVQIGKMLRRVRLNEDVTQQIFAEKIGISRMCYCNYEKGRRMPTDEHKLKIARYLGKTVDEIFFSGDDTERSKKVARNDKAG